MALAFFSILKREKLNYKLTSLEKVSFKFLALNLLKIASVHVASELFIKNSMLVWFLLLGFQAALFIHRIRTQYYYDLAT